ncbi:MAG: hypothetical protein HOP29_15550, partial [Phycisphaerales bacterium]|nr:hypothetical protein [Phycisphaerales bacterium]
MPTLSISIDATPHAWRGQWSVDDEPIGPPITADAEKTADIVRLSDLFAAIFEQPGQPPFVHP